MRDVVLHQGRTTPAEEQGSQYSRFVFEAPEGGRHGQITGERAAKEIVVNVGHLHDVMLTGMKRCLVTSRPGNGAAGAASVRGHLAHLVTVGTVAQTKSAEALGVGVAVTASPAHSG
jgi:hypothetical protein